MLRLSEINIIEGDTMQKFEIPEIKDKEPDAVTYSESGRRIEIYSKPSAEACAEVLFRLIKKRSEEVTR